MKTTLLSVCFCILLGYQVKAQRYLNEVFPQVTRISNIAYGSAPNWNGSTQNLALDVFIPDGDSLSSRPLMLFFHGGSFIGGQRDDGIMLALCNSFARRGYVTATVSYRLGVNIANTTALNREFVRAALRATHDAHAAVRFFRKDVVENGNTYGIDTNKIYIGGYSAGAIAAIHVAWLLDTTYSAALVNEEIIGMNAGLFGSSGNAGYSSSVAGVFNMAGAVLDTQVIRPGAVTGIHFHGTSDDVVPFGRDFVRALSFPVLLMDGSSLVQQRLENLNTYTELFSYTGLGHDLFSNGAISQDIQAQMARFFFNMQNNSVSVKAYLAADWLAYPNPSRGELRLKINDNDWVDVLIHGLDGRQYYSGKHLNGDVLELHHLSNGLYVISFGRAKVYKQQKFSIYK